MKIAKIGLAVLVLFAFVNVAWAQSIHFTSTPPAMGSWCKGNLYALSWTSEGHSELIRIGLIRSQGGSSSEVLLIGSNLPSNGSVNWTIPSSVPTGDGYYLTIRTMANHYGLATGPFRIELCLQQTKPDRIVIAPTTIPPLQRTTSIVPQIQYERFEQGAIQMQPVVLTIKYGTHTVTMNRGETKTISVDENSPLIDPATNGIRATVEYTLVNTVNKNFRFHVTVRFGNHFYTPVLVTFLGPVSQHVTQDVVFYPANQTLRLGVEATDILIDGGANDVRPSYFFGNLNARIFPN